MAGQAKVDVTDKLPKRVSPSRLSNYMQCPAKFYFGSILRLASPATHATTKGTLAHEAFEKIFDHPAGQRTPDLAVTYVRPAWEQLRTDPKYVHLTALGPDYEETLVADAEAAVRSWFNMENPNRFEPVGRERRMEIDVAGVPLIGILDRIDEVTYPSGAVRTVISDYKGLALDTPLPTPSGWTTMGDVTVGDTLLGIDGRPTVVTVKSEIHKRACYRVVFDDKSEIICDNVHLWQVRSRSRRGTWWKTGVVDTDTLKDMVSSRIVRVAHCSPLALPDARLPLDPYVLGVWLGDGTSRGGIVTVGAQDTEEMVELLEACGERPRVTQWGINLPSPQVDHCVHGHYDARRIGAKHKPTCSQCSAQAYLAGAWNHDYPVNGTLTSRLKYLGLLNNKHVPDVYLRGSAPQRLALLQGLMDTDGSWNGGRKQAIFASTNAALVEAVEELISSLGWSYSRYTRPYSNKVRPDQVSYQVMFTPFGQVPFRLERKASAASVGMASGTSVRSASRVVVAVEPVDSVPTQCVAVDAPDHLYLAGRNMIPTHNTGKVPDRSSRYLDEKFFGMRVYAVMHHALTSVAPFQLRLVFVTAPDRTGVFPLQCDEQLISSVTKHLKTLWTAIKRDAKRGTWECKTQPLCNYCEYQPLCPAHNPEIAHLPVELTELHNTNLAQAHAANLAAAGQTVTSVTVSVPLDAGSKDDRDPAMA